MTQENNTFKGCVWIGTDLSCPSPIIVRQFKLKQIKNAVLRITGLGFFRAKINGKNVCEDFFIPNVTDYESRDSNKFHYKTDFNTTHRIYYCEYDVTALLSDDNILEIQLGNGWYRQKERVAEGDVSFGDDLKTIYQLAIEDGCGHKSTICSDGTEEWYASEITYNNIFYGETVDPLSKTGIRYPVKAMAAPDSLICKQQGVTDRVVRIIEPELIGLADGKKIFDAGENISGVVRVYTSEGTYGRIVLRFAENITEDMRLDFFSTGADYKSASGIPQIMKDTFICDGTKRSFEPTFVWHAFRYFEIEGDFEKLEVLVIHSDVKVTAQFESSSEGLNFLFDSFVRTQLNNMHSSVPSDCPHRERLGYTGDGQVCAPASMLFLDSREFYKKWITDILDSQDIITGHVQHTAPYMGGGGGPCGWGGAIITVPHEYYRMYGDASVLEYCYDAMKRYIGYLVLRSEDGLVVREEDGGWCLGDWCTLDPVEIPEEYVNTCFFIKLLDRMNDAAKTLNRNNDIPSFIKLKNKSITAIREKFLNKETGSYCEGIQGADAYAVWAGFADAATARKAAEKYKALGHMDTGFLGTDILLEVLFDHGFSDVALKLLDGEDKGSFLYMKNRGATTLWETWGGELSHDHPMFGACARQLVTSVLGIRQAEESCGYEQIRITPKIPEKLSYASGSISTVNGEIAVSWRKELDRIHFEIIIPSGSSAVFEYGGRRYPLSSGKNVKDIAVSLE